MKLNLPAKIYPKFAGTKGKCSTPMIARDNGKNNCPIIFNRTFVYQKKDHACLSESQTIDLNEPTASIDQQWSTSRGVAFFFHTRKRCVKPSRQNLCCFPKLVELRAKLTPWRRSGWPVRPEKGQSKMAEVGPVHLRKAAGFLQNHWKIVLTKTFPKCPQWKFHKLIGIEEWYDVKVVSSSPPCIPQRGPYCFMAKKRSSLDGFALEGWDSHEFYHSQVCLMGWDKQRAFSWVVHP